MKFTNKFKIVWWVFMLVLTTFILYKRYDAIVLGNSVSLDIFIFLIFMALMLVPIFSEIEFFGIKLKKEIGDLKKDIGEMRNDIRNSQIQTVHNTFHGFGPPLPDNRLPEFKDEIDRLVMSLRKDTTAEPGSSYKIEVPTNNIKLFEIRYGVEREIKRIWQERFGNEKTDRSPHHPPVYKILQDLKQNELIDDNLYGILKEIFAICNYAIHGEIVTENQVSFITQNANKVLYYLSKIK